MAQKQIVENVDDLDGTEAVHVGVQFGLYGVNYEIDLSDANLERLTAALSDFVDKARRVGGRLRSAGTSDAAKKRTTSDPAQTAHVREWAREAGHQISDRGRIPEHINAQYQEAHAAKPAKAGTKTRSRAKRAELAVA